MSFKSSFDPASDRAIRGLKFQAGVQDSLTSYFQRVWNSREWLLLQDPCLNEIQLNYLEHTWGDIAIIDTNLPHPVFIECVSLKGENSIFPNHKIRKFSGRNKYYCFGWDDEMRFVHSQVWNMYVGKCESLAHYKKFTRNNIRNLRNQYVGSKNFYDTILQIEKRATHQPA